ncbi:MAG: hypothetical protein ACJATN_001937 [Neolewinella sp.]
MLWIFPIFRKGKIIHASHIIIVLPAFVLLLFTCSGAATSGIF